MQKSQPKCKSHNITDVKKNTSAIKGKHKCKNHNTSAKAANIMEVSNNGC